MLEKLAKQAPPEDFYLLRLISEHPRANAKTLGKLAKHPYGAIRENVARHPNADAPTLAWLSRDRSQPLRSEERRVGKSVDIGGRRSIKKKKKNNRNNITERKQQMNEKVEQIEKRVTAT